MEYDKFLEGYQADIPDKFAFARATIIFDCILFHLCYHRIIPV